MSNPSGNAGVPGQAPGDPAARPASGQAPQTGLSDNGGSTPGAAPSGQAPIGNTDKSPADYERMLADLRKEAASHRTKAADYERQLKAFTDAQLSDQQKLEARAAAAEAQLATYRQRAAQYAVQLAAQRLGVIDPEVAAALIGPRLEYADDGTPTTHESLLADLVKAKPYLVAHGAPPVASGGPTSPGAAARAGTYTREQIRTMSPREFAAQEQAIMEAMQRGDIR